MRLSAGTFRLAIALVLVMVIAAAPMLFAAGQAETEEVTTTGPQIAPGPFGKYDPPIEITAAVNIGSATFPPGQDVEDNVWMDGYMEHLGIDVKIAWAAATGDEYDQKLNVNIASGDIPDIFSVDAVKYAQLAEGDMIADLGPTYDEYASDLVKEELEAVDVTLQAATIGGELLGVPSPKVNNFTMLWVRTDWLENLGMDAPESYSDMQELIEAFVTQDPDGNGEDDTLAFPVRKELWGWPAYLEGFFNAHDAWIRIWVEDGTGGIQYGSIQPEVKDALSRLRTMYANGWLDREFAVKGNSAVFEDLASNRFGLMFQRSAGPARFRDLKKNVPESDWRPHRIPSISGGPAETEVDLHPSGFWVVREGYNNPEALWKLANFRLMPKEDKRYSWIGDVQTHLYGVRIVFPNSHAEIFNELVNEHLRQGKEYTGDDVGLQNYWDAITAWRSGDGTVQDWFFTRVFGEHGSGELWWNTEQEGLDVWKVNQFYTVPTESMAANWATLETMRDEVFTKIIMGESPLSDFDKFVSDWKKLGGDQVTAEVNAWYRSQ
jgi:putative aldouronate transport system substrate-binding protein